MTGARRGGGVPAIVGTASVQLVPQPACMEMFPQRGCWTRPGCAETESRSAWQSAITETLMRSPGRGVGAVRGVR